MKKDLSLEEKNKPYAKYFYQPAAPVPQKVLDILDKGPVDPTLATPIHQRNDLLKPGYLPSETGYCIMADGSGFVAMLIEMPGVSAEMVEWWFTWFGLESLRYKIWDPDAHYSVYVVEADLEHRLNTALSYRERRWGTTIVANEDIGGGAVDLRITFMSPEDYGHDMSLFRPPNATINNINLGLGASGKPLATAAHLYREIPGGLELRARFWLGWNVVSREAVRVVDEVPLALARGLAYHCAREYTNLAAILPGVYEENHRTIDRIQDFK